MSRTPLLRIVWPWHLSRPRVDGLARSSVTLVLLVGALFGAVITLLWLGSRAIDGWQRSARLLAERRADEKATILNVALDHDMKGVQVSVLPRFSTRDLRFANPYDVVDLFAAALARFPYPESFFVWRMEGRFGKGHLYAFSRTDRPPKWEQRYSAVARYPVVIESDPPALATLRDKIVAIDLDGPSILNEVTIDGERYQTIVSTFSDPAGGRAPIGAVGFMVNLDWVRGNYFGELTREIASVVGDADLSFAIRDDRGDIVTGTGPFLPGDPVRERMFPVAFLDRALLAAQANHRPAVAYWTARVSAKSDESALTSGRRGLLWLMALTGGAALVSVALVGRTLRITARLVAMRSDFVSTVTHDLKTPLALIRMVGEMLSQGRSSSPDTIRTYARLLSSEAAQLTLRIDNFLAYARVMEKSPAYRLDAVDLLDVVQESLRRAEPRLCAQGFEVDINLTDAPSVRGDRAALVQVIDNLIDNAIKYSGESRVLIVHGGVVDDMAYITIRDCGIGIAKEDVTQIFEKFFRGRNAGTTGSGLGLAIARRILGEHGGLILVDTAIGKGTAVTIKIPLGVPS